MDDRNSLHAEQCPASSSASSKSRDGQIGYVVRTGRIPPGVATAVAEGSGQNLTLKPLSSGSCTAIGDGELLTRLFVNLVENAITHCQARRLPCRWYLKSSIIAPAWPITAAASPKKSANWCSGGFIGWIKAGRHQATGWGSVW